MTSAMAPLAIVIPAYKRRFLDDTLRSIAAQTCRDFVVYVGDDASPEELAPICARWQGQMDLRYTRFENNLGATDLVAQWQRCVQLSQEPWVWLFSDDDLMPPNGVQSLLDAARADGGRFDLYHFNVEQIDAQGQLLRVETEFPQLLSVREFARRRLRFELSSFAPDYVFSRQAFQRLGGFVNFPRAWCSDDATWIRLGQRGGIRTIAGAKVAWRHSGDNISSRHGVDAAEKSRAQAEFLCWLDHFLVEHAAAAGEPSDTDVMEAAQRWFFYQARKLRMRFFPDHAAATAALLRTVRGLAPWRVWSAMLVVDLRLAVIDTRRRLRRER